MISRASFAIGWGLPASEGPEVMWNFFKTTTLSVAGERLGVRRVTRKGFVSEGTLRLINKSREARLSGDPEARKLRRLTVRSLRADKEAHVRSVCERIEGHLWSGDSGAAYREIRALRSSKPVSGVSSVRSAGGELLTGESEVRACWAAYFEQLYRADPPVWVSRIHRLLLTHQSTVTRVRSWKQGLR